MSKSDRPVRNGNKLNTVELIAYTIIAVLVIGGIVASNIDVSWFENVYAVEDGFIENFTIVPITIAVFVIVSYLRNVGKYRSKLFVFCMVMAAIFAFFVAGEEISWGQRVLKVESSEFFSKNNAQQETNLHNLVVNGKKVNKIVFSILLTIVVGIYLLVLPILYAKVPSVRHFTEWAGLPVAHRSQVIAAFLVFALIGLIPSGKNAEILEMGISGVFLMILLYPENAYVFRKKLEL